ncbi:multifunctional CCA addition/repair protein [Legionella sp. W05-934-2]|uniref:multifunctional CCA addition/repair protein n=1 Tax=Legionella sp. W05-934-2 TaxID=1198649 RepID=UPI003461ED55
MKIYLVGGAVRDSLLGYPYTEKDYVVTGATRQQMLDLGYEQVGKDFPVFLHPKSKEEYALARLERKKGKGYYGFEVDFSPDVTLEEDLKRRDLTINAMAMDEQGNLIDPYGGQADLEAKLIRHVSNAFIEDPVRVLRVARFIARYYHMGFRLADETRILMAQMTRSGELENLVPERVWQECERALSENNPEQFFVTLRQIGALAIIFPELDKLFGVPNKVTYHPEIDSGIHSLYSLQACTTKTNNSCMRFAALVHDLGKAETQMSDWPSHPGHDEAGEPIIRQLCKRLKIPNDYQSFALLVCRFHLLIHRVDKLSSDEILFVLNHADAFRRSHRFEQLLVVSEADINGTGRKMPFPQGDKWRYLLSECAKVQAQDVIKQGFKDQQIKLELDARRLACIDIIQKMWKENEKK